MSALGAGGTDDALRLRAIARSADGPTLDLLGELLPSRPAGVVDLGCGTGSVAIELARSRPADQVWAVDHDTDLLPAASTLPGNVRVVRSDLRSWSPASTLDLVHARYVLAHLHDREEQLRRAVSWLGSGGHLVVTEPCHLPRGAGSAVDRVIDAYGRLAEADGLSFSFAHRVAGLMTAQGLADVSVSARAVRLGGGAGVDRWSPLVERLADRLAVPDDDLEAFRAFAAATDTFAVPQVVLTTSGRR